VNDNYDNQSVGERCGSFWLDGSDSIVTSELSSSGSKSCKMNIRKGKFGWGGGVWLGEHGIPLRKGDEMWVRFRVFMPAGFDYGVYSAGDTLKFIRLQIQGDLPTHHFEWEWMREGKSKPHGSLLEYRDCSSYSDCWAFFGSRDDAPTRGVWDTWEMYVKVDDVPVDEGGHGKTLTWKNGKLIGKQTRISTINNSNDTIDAIRFFSYWNGGAPKTQHLYFDDLVWTNERPTATDSQGNPHIGVGNFVAVASPMPPSSIQ
jgi:hypothetical protein